MKRNTIFILTTLCGILLCITDGNPDRMAPKKVAPVEFREYMIKVNHEKMGYIEVYDRKGTLLWDRRIYRVGYNPFLERDVQDVYISKIFIDRELLIIANERGHYYSLDLRTKRVRRLSEKEAGKYKASPEKAAEK